MKKYCVLLIFLFSGSLLQAQDEDKKWALEYTGGVWSKPVLTDNPSGVDLGNSGAGFTLTGEYYLPKKWNLQAGYFRREISYGDGDRTMEGLQLGIKKYFLNPEFMFQPYLLGAGQVNWSHHSEYYNYVYDDYARKQYTLNPRISLVPGVGIDIYMFSSIAFVMEYNFNIGLNSRTTLDVSQKGMSPYMIQDKGMYHYLGLGVKVTFPFTVTSNDGMTLFEIIFDTVLNALNQY